MIHMAKLLAEIAITLVVGNVVAPFRITIRVTESNYNRQERTK